MIDCLTTFAHHFLSMRCVAFAVSDACKLGRGRVVLECELELLLEMLRGSEFWRRVGSRLLEIASWEELVGGCTTADADDAACEPLANSAPPETGR